jgi:hypothetical protein
MRDAEAPFHQTVGEAFKDSIKNGVRVIRAAKDPVTIPTDPMIVEIATNALCHLGLGHNCFTLTSVYGIEAEVPYGATVDEWQRIATRLLKGAMDES